MIKRLTEIEIAGKKYALNYSIRAQRKLLEIGMVDEKATVIDSVEHNVRYLHCLLEEGIEFKRRFLGERDADLDLTVEDLLTYFTMADNAAISKAINECIESANKRETVAKKGKASPEGTESVKTD